MIETTSIYLVELERRILGKKDVQQEHWETTLDLRFHRFKTLENTLGEKMQEIKPVSYVEFNLRRTTCMKP